MRARPVVCTPTFCALIVSVLSIAACSNSSGTLPTTTAADTTLSVAAPTVAESTIADTTTADTTVADTTVADTTVLESTTTTTTTTAATTTTIAPPTTIMHGAGVTSLTPDGTPINPVQLVVAKSIYEAAVTHDYDRLKAIIGDRRFRWGFVGERGPAEAWKVRFDEGKGDELARMATLLETPPGIDSQGNAIWPYLSIKDPTTWTEDDRTLLSAKLGFNAENIAQTMAKGRYVDYKLQVDAEGLWTAFGVGY